MSYVWSTQGPAFEYPTCYRTENRFLTLRAAALFLFAFAMLWVALSDPVSAKSASSVLLRTRLERGDPTPHVLFGLLLLVLGVLDLVSTARHRRVMLLPGQPASLTNELSRKSSGTSSGAAWLLTMLRSGKVAVPELRESYRRPLLALARDIAIAPTSLQAYLRVRLAHLLFAFGLLVALGLSWLLVPSPATLAVASLLYAALAAALVARSAWITKAAPSPVAVGVVLLGALISGLAIGWFADAVPHVAKLQQLGLPMAAALVLLCMLVIEGLGLMAGLKQVGKPAVVDVSAAEASAEFVSEPSRLMQEVERELHRYWAEGIPNRRHAWEPPGPDAQARLGGVSALVLEESQPTLTPDQNDDVPAFAAGRQIWLLALLGLGLLLSLAGGALAVSLASAQMKSAAAPWLSAAPALVLVVAGAYAMRAGHLLWSRFEVASTLLWLDFKTATAADAAPAETGSPMLRLRTCVVQVRSVFYAAAEHKLGTRTLLRLKGDADLARRFVQQVKAFAERAPAVVPAVASASRPGAGLAQPARPAVVGAAAAAPSAARVTARFCPACGTPVIQGARFCQHCGQALQPG